MKNVLSLLITMLAFSSLLEAQEYGLASFYSDKFQGRPTASGELYDKDKLTASHKTLPFDTYIRVTRLDNKKSVVVRVNDRGPYISGRVVDVSRKAAEALDLFKEGTASVKVEVVSKPSAVEEEPAQPVVDNKPKEPTPAAAAAAPKAEEKPATPKAKETTPAATTAPKTAEKPKTPVPSVTTPPSSAGTSNNGPVLLTDKNYQSYDLYKLEVTKPEKKGFAVQIASLASYDNAMRQIAELQGKFLKDVLLSVEKGPNNTTMYKVLLGPFPDRAAAEAYQKNVKKRFKLNGFIVDLATISYGN
ncbi:MAG: septal ring lytic transglycosylase RlpA family protein [Saprospiraceae bacterium]